MQFRHRSSPRVRFFSNRPVGVTPVFKQFLDDNGVTYLKQTGETDINAFVQASKDATLVYNILDRFQKGETDVLMKSSGYYMDAVGLPTSLAEAHNLMVGIEQKFLSLPLDLRRAFDNSPYNFARRLQDGSINEVFGSFAQKAVLDQPASEEE